MKYYHPIWAITLICIFAIGADTAKKIHAQAKASDAELVQLVGGIARGLVQEWKK